MLVTTLGELGYDALDRMSVDAEILGRAGSEMREIEM